jgi:predicted lipoprotein with Yx(FWY)xxD motif
MKRKQTQAQLMAGCFIVSLVLFSMMWAAPPENVVTTRTVAQVEKAHGLTVAIDKDGEPQSCTTACHGEN